MDTEKEKRDYMEKAGRIDKKIDSILKMESGDLITKEMRSQLQKIQKEARRVYRKLKNDEFEIAVVGLEKSGKSSFSNALIERNLLPTANERCTYTATCIKYAEEDNAVIRFYKTHEFEQDFMDKLRKIGIRNPESYSYRTLTQAKYEELYSQRAEDGSRFDETLNEDILNIINNRSAISRYLGEEDTVYRGDELTQSEFQRFIKEPAQAIPVKEVIIGSCRALSNMKTAIIYDVPGFNSPTEMHREQTLDKMKSADAIIMVAKGDEPSLTADVLKIFRESDNDGTQLKDKLFVFANKSERSDDFQENQEKTWEQWVRKYSYIDEREKNWRIIFGSANAHLEKCGQIEGDDCTRAVEKKGLPNGDGIDYIKSSLEEYNRTHRFKVLKRRIDKLGADLKEVFRDVSSGYGNSWSEYNRSAKLGMELVTKALKMIPEILDDYKEYIKSEMSLEPLSQDIRDKIDEIVSLEEYKITDEEIQKKHAKYSKSAGNEQFNRVDTEIRQERCDKMYDRFSREVVKMVLNQHKQYEEEIVDKCLEAIGVSETSRYRDDLKGKLKELLKTVIGYGEGDYYQSLVERYSRDIYEILIYSQYNDERLARFYEDANNFYSLSVFYRPREMAYIQDKNEIIYGDEPIKNLPMCRRLLFHTTRDGEENTIKAYEKINDFFKEHSEELLGLVRILGTLAPMDVEKIVLDVCRLLDVDDENTRLFDAKEQLKRKIREKEKGNIYAMDILDKEAFKIQYRRFHETRKQDYESLKSDFLDDMIILKDILINAFVPAVNIEKPFLAKEQKIIDDIKALLEQNEFQEFLSTNMSLIKYSEWGELDEAEGRRRMNEACMREIQELLREING